MQSRRTTSPQFGKTFVEVFLSALGNTITPPPIDVGTAEMRLCTAMPSPLTPNLLPGDFTVPTNTALAAQAVDPSQFGAPVLNPAGDGMSVFNTFVWVLPIDPVTPETVIGYYIYNGTDLVIAERFADPVAFSTAGDGLSLESYLPVIWNPQV